MMIPTKILTPALLGSVFFLLGCAQQAEDTAGAATSEVYDQVNIFVGTGGTGHTTPAATVPFGMVQLGPDTGNRGWKYCAGYQHGDTAMLGFSHTHLSGTGIGDLLDVLVSPKLTEQPAAPQPGTPLLPFDKATEDGRPGYYRVQLGSGLSAEMTADTLVGYHRYTPDRDGTIQFSVDLDHMMHNGWTANTITEANLELVNDTLLVGHRVLNNWAKRRHVYFAMSFSQPVSALGAYEKGNWQEGATKARVDSAKVLVNGDVLELHLTVPATAGQAFEIRTGLSAASVQGALAAVQAKYQQSFEACRAGAEAAWRQALAGWSFQGDTEAQAIAASALYHTLLSPTQFSDQRREYRTSTDSLCQLHEGAVRKTIFSQWDVFRAQGPLLALTQPQVYEDIMWSFIDYYRELGHLPIWGLWGNETGTMVGYHSVPMLALDMLHNPDPAYDMDEAYQALLVSSRRNIPLADVYAEYGYIPADKGGWSVTRTLEYAFDDWCIAAVARKLGKQDDADLYMERSRSWQALFDPDVGFARGKNADGSWSEPFDPYHSEHTEEALFIEGTAWQYTWFVPHDVGGLIQAFGGQKRFEERLDSLFNTSSELKGDNVSLDISGLVGQYAHGNEPSHHIAYLYTLAGAAHKTQERVAMLRETMYANAPDGLAGNEDCGQMSAWYVFSAMGIYPVNPASGVFALTTPEFDRATMPVGGGATFTVEKQGEGAYIQSVTLNGVPLNRLYVLRSELQAGGTLAVTVGSEPSTTLVGTIPPML